MTSPPDEPGNAPHHSARDARGGEIILRTRRRRLLFFGGLIAFVLLALILRLAS